MINIYNKQSEWLINVVITGSRVYGKGARKYKNEILDIVHEYENVKVVEDK